MPRKLTQAEFVAKAVAVHGVDRYDYSQVVYVRNTTELKIICPQHGLFLQTGQNHLSGRGCNLCGRAWLSELRGDTKSFISAAQAKHGKRYDYSQSVYSGGKTKLRIICKLHGVFEQSATDHIQGRGCQKCQGLLTSQRCRSNTNLFIRRAMNVHGSRYDYSQVAYIGSKEKVVILCSKHGQFQQSPLNHLMGKGCAACAGRNQNTTSFIERAKAVHGDKYDYTETDYIAAKMKVKISCPIHGEFLQEPSSHLNGCGCNGCGGPASGWWNRSEWVEKAKGKTPQLYLIKCFSDEEVFYKVGITFRSVAERFSRRLPYQYEVLKTITYPNPEIIYDLEINIKKQFSDIKYKPKQEFPGATECFSSADEILAIFPI